MRNAIKLAMVGLVSGLFVAGATAESEAGYWGKKKTKVVSNKAGHRIYVPAHWDHATKSYIYPEYITVKPHTPGHRHYATRYRAVRVHEGMTFKRSRTVIEASFCDQPFDSKTSKYRGKQRVFRVCP